MTQSGAHMQQLNAGDEWKIKGGSMGVFSSGFGRLIGQNSPFLDSTAPTQGSVDVAITVSPKEL